MANKWLFSTKWISITMFEHPNGIDPIILHLNTNQPAKMSFLEQNKTATLGFSDFPFEL